MPRTPPREHRERCTLAHKKPQIPEKQMLIGKIFADRLFGCSTAPKRRLKTARNTPGLAPILLRFSGKLRFSCKCRVRQPREHRERCTPAHKKSQIPEKQMLIGKIFADRLFGRFTAPSGGLKQRAIRRALPRFFYVFQASCGFLVSAAYTTARTP